MRSPIFLQVTFITLALGCSSESSSNHSPSAGGSSSAGTTGSGGNEDGSSGSSQGGSTSHLPSFGKSGNAGTDDGGVQGEGGMTNSGDGGIDDDGGAGGDVNAGGNGGNGSGGADPGEDTTAPSIASISPEDGASGVQSDAEIVIEFSEAMNTASVEGAFDSGNLPGLDFSWNTANTILTLTPQSELSYAEGFDTSVVAEGYDFGIATGAQDLAGDSLPAADFDFTTLRRIATVLSGVSNLDGFAQADGMDDHSYDEELVVGSSDDVKIAGLLTFDISVLPAGIEDFETAQVNVTQTATYASYGAYDDLGDLYLEHVTFSAVNAAAATATALRNLGVIATTPSNEVKHRSVTVALTEDYAQRVSRSNRSQYRLAFPSVGASDAGYVVTGFTTAEATSNAPELEATYLIP
jgi:hypothetical protein